VAREIGVAAIGVRRAPRSHDGGDDEVFVAPSEARRQGRFAAREGARLDQFLAPSGERLADETSLARHYSS